MHAKQTCLAAQRAVGAVVAQRLLAAQAGVGEGRALLLLLDVLHISWQGTKVNAWRPTWLLSGSTFHPNRAQCATVSIYLQPRLLPQRTLGCMSTARRELMQYACTPLTSYSGWMSSTCTHVWYLMREPGEGVQCSS